MNVKYSEMEKYIKSTLFYPMSFLRFFIRLIGMFCVGASLLALLGLGIVHMMNGSSVTVHQYIMIFGIGFTGFLTLKLYDVALSKLKPDLSSQ